MKKITKTVKAFAALMLVVLMSACGSKVASPEEVAAKITNGETLTQNDYKVMIDYVGDYATKALVYQNKINVQPNDSTPEYIKASNEWASLYQKYPYLAQFRQSLTSADMSQFDEANQQLINQYANDPSFPLPGGEGVALENPNVQGMVEDMPANQNSNVISTGDGEAVN